MRRVLFLVLVMAAAISASTRVFGAQLAGFATQAGATAGDRAAPAGVGAPGAPKATANAEELFKRFALFGTWARHCKGKPTPVNPHVRISNPSAGLVLEDHDLGPGYAVNRYSVVAAAALSPTRLSVEAIFQPGKPDEERQRLIYEVRGGTRRTLYNRTDGGAERVKGGIALAAGTRTPVLRKCR